MAFNHILNIAPIFHHGDDYFEYFLGDPMYMGEKMFIMCRIRKWELAPDVDHDAMRTFNKYACRS